MKAKLLAAAGVLLASSAIAQVAQPTPPGSANTTTPPAAAAPGAATTGATGAMAANDFVQKVAVSDMFEIQSSQLALDKKADRDTKPCAQKMMKDH
jgi:hypothetical protein